MVLSSQTFEDVMVLMVELNLQQVQATCQLPNPANTPRVTSCVTQF